MSEFQFKWLSIEDLPKQQILEDTVMQRLSEAGKGHFFTPLSYQQKKDTIISGDYIASYWKNDAMIGQMIVEEAIFPNKLSESYTPESIKTLNLSASHGYYLRNSLMHPEYQGRKVLESLFEKIYSELNEEYGYFTVIHPSNIPSIRLGKNIGFEPYGTVTRIRDRESLNIYHARSRADTLSNAESARSFRGKQ